MHKNKIMSKLNDQKGITVADVVMALLIILITVGVISSVYVNIVVDSKGVDRKTGATRIATNIIENISMLYYDQVADNLETLVTNGLAIKQSSSYVVNGSDSAKILETSVPTGYNVTINLANTYGTQVNLQYDLVKKITVKVEYKLDGQTKNVTLNKVIEKEVIRECNSPNFSTSYIRQMVAEGTDYQMYSATASSAGTGVKIICPIQYDVSSSSYKIVEDTSSLWYSYSNKEWARVLVLDASEVASYINSSTKLVSDTSVLTGDKAYVWIPRFGVENGADLFGGVLFKYNNTDFAIVSSYNSDEEMTQNYLDESIIWATRGLSFESNELFGNWSPYSDISTSGTDAYSLANSQYGPLIEN